MARMGELSHPGRMPEKLDEKGGIFPPDRIQHFPSVEEFTLSV